MARWFYIPLFTALIYCVFFQLNNFLFGWLEFSSGVNWVFLPSGLRLLLVLLWGPWASIGISIGSAWLSFAYYPFNSEIDFLVTGLISGASPLLARFIAEHSLKWDVGLSSKSPLVLIKLALMFALISSTLHQIWFSWMGRSEDFLKGIFVMFTGDIFGTLLLLYAFKFILFLADTIQDKKPLI
jgi:hypothetical protein